MCTYAILSTLLITYFSEMGFLSLMASFGWLVLLAAYLIVLDLR